MSNQGVSIDQLLAQQAQGPAPAAPQADPLDTLLAAQASGQAIPSPAGPSAAPSVPQGSQEAPNWRQQLMGGPVGQALTGALKPIYGADQLAYKGLGAATSFGGNYPNLVSDFFEGRAKAVGDESAQANKSSALAAILTGNKPNGLPDTAGQILSPVNFAAGAVSVPSRLGTALLQGASLGATSPTDDNGDYWTQKAEQTGLGAATGGILRGAGKVASTIADPAAAYGAKVATLLKAGVPLTAGQIIGGGVRRLEDASTSIPFVGDMVKNRHRDALEAFTRAPVNDALSEVGDKLPPGLIGHKANQYALDSMDTAYGSVLSKMSATADAPFKTDLNNIVNNATKDYGLTGSDKQRLQDLIQGQVIAKSDNGFYSGDTLKDVQSNLSYQQRNYSKSQNPNDKNLSDALSDVRSSFEDMLSRQNPQQAPELANVNRGYAKLVRPLAASEAAMKDGVYTPGQLGMAVRRGGTRNQNATGAALGQDFASAGQSVLPSTVPDSGTPFRHALEGAAALAGAGFGGEHLAVPGATEAAMGAAGLGGILGLGGTQAVQSGLRAALTKRPYSAATAKQLGQVLMNAPSIVGRVAIPALTPTINNNGPK